MDESFLKEHVARCRSLAGISNDPFIKKRLLALAGRYEETMNVRGWPRSTVPNLPVNTFSEHHELKAKSRASLLKRVGNDAGRGNK